MTDLATDPTTRRGRSSRAPRPSTAAGTAPAAGTSTAARSSNGAAARHDVAHPPIHPAAAALLAPHPTWVPPTPGLTELATGVVVGTTAALASPLISGPILSAFGGLRDERPPADPSRDAGDPGWFGPDSVAWRVHADISLLVAGLAAFALQSLHPLAMAGVAEHSSFADDFMGRTQRTGQFVQGVVYGSSPEAERRCRTVNLVHTRVVGVAPDGRPYDATDPELLEWVHIAEYLAIAAAHRRFGVRPMTRGELDRYVGEVARVGEGTGVLSPPRSWDEMHTAFERHRPNLAVGEYAAAGLGYLVEPPFIPRAALPVWRLLWAGAVACVPPVARTLLRVPDPTTAQLAGCRALLRTFSSGGGVPPPLRDARLRLGLPETG